jgi:hypothetical protein
VVIVKQQAKPKKDSAHLNIVHMGAVDELALTVVAANPRR